MVRRLDSPLTFDAIGVVRSPFVDKKDAPRQPSASTAEGTIELFSGRDLEDALSGIEAWSHLWVLYVFDRAGGYRPKVLPPRAHEKKGVLATRSPHRPNPIGLSVVRLLGVRGLCLDVGGVDMLDGSPVIDLKPYVAYTDAIQDASAGWLAVDPAPAYEVVFSAEARADLECLRSHGVDLEEPIVRALSLGPAPHAYRRIKKDGATSVLAVKDWRVRFGSEARKITVIEVFSGYSPRQLASRPDLEPHRVLGRTRR